MMRSRHSFQTFTGIFFDPFAFDPGDIRIEDIAHSLSMQCRFAGHIRRRWSVAQHSILVADLLEPRDQLCGLLHDAAEAYILDMPTPVKNHPNMQVYREIEHRIQLSIAARFGIRYPIPPTVRLADLVVRWAEADALHHGTVEWPVTRDEKGSKMEGLGLDLNRYDSLVDWLRTSSQPTDENVRDSFLAAFRELSRAR